MTRADDFLVDVCKSGTTFINIKFHLSCTEYFQWWCNENWYHFPLSVVIFIYCWWNDQFPAFISYNTNYFLSNYANFRGGTLQTEWQLRALRGWFGRNKNFHIPNTVRHFLHKHTHTSVFRWFFAFSGWLRRSLSAYLLYVSTTYQYLNSRPCWPLAEPRKITGKWLEVKEGDGLLRITLIILLLLLCSLALLLCVWHCLDWTQLDNTVSSTHQRKSFQSFPFFGVSSTSSAQSRTAW